MLQLVNPCQLDTVALKLDGGSHLLAGIPATHITMTSAHATGRIRGANLVDYRAAAFRKPHSLAPDQQLFISQHELSFFTSFARRVASSVHAPTALQLRSPVHAAYGHCR